MAKSPGYTFLQTIIDIRTSPIDIAMRKYSGKKRFIFDLSIYCSGLISGINSFIRPESFCLHYTIADNAIKLMKLTCQGAWLFKVDITDAFKIVPIHPSQGHCFGIRWDSEIYFGVPLTFSCRSSLCIFKQVSEALCWIL